MHFSIAAFCSNFVLVQCFIMLKLMCESIFLTRDISAERKTKETEQDSLFLVNFKNDAIGLGSKTKPTRSDELLRFLS